MNLMAFPSKHGMDGVWHCRSYVNHVHLIRMHEKIEPNVNQQQYATARNA